MNEFENVYLNIINESKDSTNIVGKWEYVNKDGEKLTVDIKSKASKHGNKLSFILKGGDLEEPYNSLKNAGEFEDLLGWWLEDWMDDFKKELNNAVYAVWGEKFSEFTKVK